MEPRAQARAEPLSRKDITMSRQDTSSATKILWGQIIIVSIVALLFVWAATQWVAFRLGFQPQLGAPLTALFGLPIYRPWQVFTWWYWYDAYAPRVFMEGAAIAGAGGIAAIAVAHLAVGPAGARGERRDNLWLGQMGKPQGYHRRRAVRRRRGRARPPRQALPPA